MAGIVVLAAGWSAFSTGAGAGSLAFAFLSQDLCQPVAEPNAVLYAVLGGLFAINHVLAQLQMRRKRQQGEYGVFTFPFIIYMTNLCMIGYGITVALSHAFYHRLSTTDPAPSTSRGMCSLYAALLAILPLPMSTPLAFLYMLAITCTSQLLDASS